MSAIEGRGTNIALRLARRGGAFSKIPRVRLDGTPIAARLPVPLLLATVSDLANSLQRMGLAIWCRHIDMRCRRGGAGVDMVLSVAVATVALVTL